ncbi:unnamed protein product, partial [marine sediment metagenome]
PVTAGGEVTYIVEVSNAGPSDATNVVVTDTLPIEATLVSVTGCDNDPNGVPACDLGTIASGDSDSYTVTVTIDGDTSDGTVVSNEVIVASDVFDPNAANDTAVAETTVGDVVLEYDIVVELSQDSVPADGSTEVFITVTITDQFGDPIEDGQAVVISMLENLGVVSPDTAITDGGQVVFTFVPGLTPGIETFEIELENGQTSTFTIDITPIEEVVTTQVPVGPPEEPVPDKPPVEPEPPVEEPPVEEIEPSIDEPVET